MDVTRTGRPLRTFHLTWEQVDFIDTLPNRSAWLRDILDAVITKKEEPVTMAQVKRVVEDYLKRASLNPISIVTGQDMEILDEIDAILSMGNKEGES